MDPLLVILATLLAATLTAFLLGFIAYPLGWLALLILTIARFRHLQRRDDTPL